MIGRLIATTWGIIQAVDGAQALARRLRGARNPVFDQAHAEALRELVGVYRQLLHQEESSTASKKRRRLWTSAAQLLRELSLWSAKPAARKRCEDLAASLIPLIDAPQSVRLAQQEQELLKELEAVLRQFSRQ